MMRVIPQSPQRWGGVCSGRRDVVSNGMMLVVLVSVACCMVVFQSTVLQHFAEHSSTSKGQRRTQARSFRANRQLGTVGQPRAPACPLASTRRLRCDPGACMPQLALLTHAYTCFLLQNLLPAAEPASCCMMHCTGWYRVRGMVEKCASHNKVHGNRVGHHHSTAQWPTGLLLSIVAGSLLAACVQEV